MAAVNQVWPLYRRLLGYVRPYRGGLIMATVAMGIVAACNSGVPLLVKPVMDGIFVERRAELLVPVAIAVVLLFTVKGLAGFLQGYLMGRIGHGIVADLRRDLVRALLRQELAFFVERPTGELVSRLTYDTTQIQNAVTRALTGVFQHVLTIVGLTVVVFYQNWRLALAAVLVFPIAVWPLARFGRAIRTYATRGQRQMATLNALLFEAVSAIRVVKVFRMEGTLAARIQREIARLFDTFRRTAAVEALGQPVMEWIGALGIGVIIVLGGRYVIAGSVSTGEFFAFVTGAMMLYDPVRRLNGTWQEIQRGVAAAERIFAWLDREPTIAAPPRPRPLPRVVEGIRFERVSFRYRPDGPLVLDALDLELPAGRVTALVGRSGAGKSTIADLVPRFYDPTEGAVRLDGVDLRELDPAELRGAIAMVDQHTVLFDDTVRNNIRYGRPDASDAEIEAAARAAFAHDFILELPDGYETWIGEDGVTLSGGQRQRIAIARAILKGAPILILDEATSALDIESEREVQAALEALMRGRTVLVIAHRLSTVRNADRIYVLDRGRVVEVGTHDELLARGGLYRRLYEEQTGGGG